MGTTNEKSSKTARVMELIGRKPDPGRRANGIVSNSDTTAEPIPAREQIEYIDIDRIDDDPNNFYELSGLDELAANIELLGLQQPIRVRPGAEPGRYIIVSGHRRRAAVRQLVMDGHGELRDLPCIVDRSEESAALQELRLIYANSDTRKLSSAEIGKQAERVETLLYQLQEEGYEFPGRMRDHVAEACKVSKTKLARLKVIREKLAGSWRKPYEKGKLAEATAYTLAQMPGELQQVIWDGLAKQGEATGSASEWTVRDYGDKLAAIDKIECKTWGHGPCLNRERMQERLMSQGRYKYNYCTQCCEKCSELVRCKYACQLLADRVEQLKADAKAQKQKEAQSREEQERPEREQVEGIWARFAQGLEKSGKTLAEVFDAADVYPFESEQKKAEKWARLENIRSDTPLPFGAYVRLDDAEHFIAIADALDVSLDYLLCRTDDPAGMPSMGSGSLAEAPRSCAQEPAPMPDGQLVFNGWCPGGTLPRTPGEAVVDFDFGDGLLVREYCEFDGLAFRFLATGIEIEAKPVRWMMLPPVPEGGCGDGDT